MKALLIGSRAEYRAKSNSDWDYIVKSCDVREFVSFIRTQFGPIVQEKPIDSSHAVVKFKSGVIVEYEIAYIDSSGADILDLYPDKRATSVASYETMYTIRESCRYRDFHGFHKNMLALDAYQIMSSQMSDYAEILQKRRKEYQLRPNISLNKSKEQFFTDNISYIYEHDSLHEIFSFDGTPAYQCILSGQVIACKEKFSALPDYKKDWCVIEEALVIATERAYIPFVGHIDVNDPAYAHLKFRTALQKICTTLTSGWFREYASKNYVRLSTPGSYVNRFGSNFFEFFEKNKHKAKKL